MAISVFDRVENIVGKGEIASTSNFSFYHNVFKRLLFQTHQKVSLCGNGLTKLKIFENDNLNGLQMKISVFDWVENVGKGENAGYQHFLLFPQCFGKPSISGSLKLSFVW